MTRAGINRLVETIERTRLAWPMALLMAAAAAFLAYAVPAAIVERAVAGVAPLAALAIPFGAAARGVMAVAVALLSGAAVWVLFDRLDGGRAAALDEAPDIDLFAPEPGAAPAPQLRRADAHPDAPARRPIFAASDLGVPMDDVTTGQTPFGRPPLFAADAPSIVPPATAPVAWDADDLLVLDERYVEAPVPASVATLYPAPAIDESIAGLMARLERGLERRGGPAAGSPDDADGGLRSALDELRRMTSGR